MWQLFSLVFLDLSNVHSKAELRSNGDEVSSCCRPFGTGNASEKCLPVWTLLYGSLKHILLKLTSNVMAENIIQKLPPNQITGFLKVCK